MGETASATVVVTGSTRGIGLALAREFLRAGANVVVCGRSAAGVDAAVADLSEGAADRVLGVPCDVADPDSVQALWDAAAARFGAVDVWVNNAGTTTVPVPLWQVEQAEVEATVTTNLLGTLYGCRVAARGMQTQPGGGRIFNVEGLGSKGETQEGLLTYGTTKAAVNYLVKALNRELKATNVAVCAVRPGINVTEHLLHGADALSPERWAKTKKVFNILGDRPDTTAAYLAPRILAARKPGTRVAWLTPARITARFALAPFRRRDLFEHLEVPS